MSKLPDIEIIVWPADVEGRMWHWEVQERATDRWQTLWSGWDGLRQLKGSARTEEKARIKARKAAADHCTMLKEKEEKRQFVSKHTTTEKVTCEGM